VPFGDIRTEPPFIDVASYEATVSADRGVSASVSLSRTLPETATCGVDDAPEPTRSSVLPTAT